MMEEKEIRALYERMEQEKPSWEEGIELLERILEIESPPVPASKGKRPDSELEGRNARRYVKMTEGIKVYKYRVDCENPEGYPEYDNVVFINDLEAVFEKRKEELETKMMNTGVQMLEVVLVQKLQELRDVYKSIFGKEMQP